MAVTKQASRYDSSDGRNLAGAERHDAEALVSHHGVGDEHSCGRVLLGERPSSVTTARLLHALAPDASTLLGAHGVSVLRVERNVAFLHV